jgi:hypothetical protein
VADTASNNPALMALQAQFAIIDLNGEFRYIDLAQIADILSGHTPGDPAFYKKPDAILLMKRALEMMPYPVKSQVVIEEFFVSTSTTFFKGTAFTPKPTSPRTLNFWTGPCAPNASGDAEVILKHLREVICNGDSTICDYLMGYLAHMVQKPEDKPGVMIVLLGKQGTGKGMFFRLLRAIWPRTTLLVTDIEQVIGRFNASIERHYAVCMDEAIFAGDRRALDRLKSLISEPQVTIEQKYQPTRSIESIHRFFAASNHDHFAHVEKDDRRFVFLRVSDVHQQDSIYFSQLNAALNDSVTVGAFLNHLLGIDLASFEVRKKPDTHEHAAQKLKSLQGFDRWWLEVLLTGEFGAGRGMYDCPTSWSGPAFVPSTSLVRDYTGFNAHAQRHQPVQSGELLAAIRKLCPSAAQSRRVCQPANLAVREQKRGLQLPDIATARSEFERVLGSTVEWG